MPHVMRNSYGSRSPRAAPCEILLCTWCARCDTRAKRTTWDDLHQVVSRLREVLAKVATPDAAARQLRRADRHSESISPSSAAPRTRPNLARCADRTKPGRAQTVPNQCPNVGSLAPPSSSIGPALTSRCITRSLKATLASRSIVIGSRSSSMSSFCRRLFPTHRSRCHSR